MSKFCGIISNRQNSEELTPLEFNHLDIVADWLNHETAELHSAFNTKCECMQEQQQQLLKNEKNLQNIHSSMQALTAKVAATENDVAIIDCDIENMERAIDRLERLTDRPTVLTATPNPQSQRPRPRYGHEKVLGMLQDTDNLMMHLNLLMREIGDQEPYMQRRSNPYNTICSILDYHVQTLQKTAENLDCLLDKTTAVDAAFLKSMNLIAAQCRKIPALPPPAICDTPTKGSQN